jgi:hypothetical protein
MGDAGTDGRRGREERNAKRRRNDLSGERRHDPRAFDDLVAAPAHVDAIEAGLEGDLKTSRGIEGRPDDTSRVELNQSEIEARRRGTIFEAKRSTERGER